MRARRRIIGLTVCVMLVVGGSAGCAPSPQDGEWVLSPISSAALTHESALPAVIDTPVPMSLVSDTAGGFWGVSSGSYRHFDAAGVAVRGFALDTDDPDGPVAALSPTELIVSSPLGTRGVGAIQLLDTGSMRWTVLHEDHREIGAVSVTEDAVYFIAYEWTRPPMTFTVERLDLNGGTGPVAVSPELAWTERISIAAGDDGTVYVATQEERIELGADGEIVASTDIASSSPLVSVGPDGSVAWSGADAPEVREAYIDGGSPAARDIVRQHVECDADEFPFSHDADWITIETRDRTVIVPLCLVAGFAWTSDDGFAMSVGTEGGGALVSVRPPS